MESKFSANPMVKGRATAGGDGAELSGGGRGGSKVCIRSDRSIFFEVDSMPGETTVVSWTKLLKDHAAEIAAGASSSSKLNAVPGGQFPPASSTRILHIPKKVGVSARDRSSLLEKAIKDLEKLVAESRPPSAEIQHANSSARATKMVLPPEIKLELANVAKYAEATDGMIRQELVSQLMGIVGHLVHRRTLKRNLKVMVNKELSAKQEKETRVQLIKKEVAEMFTARIPLMKSKARASQHFQEIGTGEREVLQWKYSMDDLLEDKICDLYDLYVEGLEEKAVPQVRKLYAELSALWPNGFMDNHGISRAIRRAKDRRKASNSCHKDPEKLKRMEIAAGNSEAARDLYAGAFLCSSSRAGN